MIAPELDFYKWRQILNPNRCVCGSCDIEIIESYPYFTIRCKKCNREIKRKTYKRAEKAWNKNNPKKEYIERNELIENLNKFAPEHYNALINQLITKQPTADVVEVKHGEWLVCNGIVSCSVCKENAKLEDYDDTAPFGGYAETKYCPNCGARMDGRSAT